MTEKPTNTGKPWVPDLMFDSPAKKQNPAVPLADAMFPSFDRPVAAPVVRQPAPEAAPSAAEGATTTLTEAPPTVVPVAAAPESIGDLERTLVAQEKALRDIRIHCRNLQDTIAKAKHGFMFGDKSKMAAAKEKMETLTAEHQQGEVEERRLVTETLALRTRIEKLRR